MAEIRRRGNALVIVLALALLLAAQLSIVSTLSSGNVKQLGRVTAHVRASTVSESAFANILVRIKGTAWSDRFFKDAPAVENDVPLVGGTYSSFVSTVPTTSDHLADVWIRGRFDGAVSVMYWRVKVIEDTLDFSARVYPQFFTHLPGDGSAPTGAPGDPTTAVVETMIAKQKANRPTTLQTLKTLDPIGNLSGILSTIGAVPAGAPVDDRQGAPQPPYIASVRLPANFPPLPATPPPALTVPPPAEQSESDQHDNDDHAEHDRDGGGHDGRGEDHGSDHEGHEDH